MNPTTPNYNFTGQSSTGIPKYDTNYNYSTPTPSGTSSINGYTSPNFGNFNTGQNQNLQNFSQGQANQIGAFQGAYNSAVQALPTYQALNQANNQQYNVQPLMQNATNLNNQVLRLPSENFGLTQGSDTSQGQLDQMNNVQLSRLEPLAQNATAQAQQAQTLSNQATGYGIQNEAFQTSPYSNTVPLLQSQMASAASGFNQQSANELAALQAAVTSGTTLTVDQQDNLNKLQQAKEAYDQAVATANITANSANYVAGLNNQYQNIKAGDTLYNVQAPSGTNPAYKAA